MQLSSTITIYVIKRTSQQHSVHQFSSTNAILPTPTPTPSFARIGFSNQPRYSHHKIHAIRRLTTARQDTLPMHHTLWLTHGRIDVAWFASSSRDTIPDTRNKVRKHKTWTASMLWQFSSRPLNITGSICWFHVLTSLCSIELAFEKPYCLTSRWQHTALIKNILTSYYHSGYYSVNCINRAISTNTQYSNTPLLIMQIA